jgi:hypothetical protein
MAGGAGDIVITYLSITTSALLETHPKPSLKLRFATLFPIGGELLNAPLLLFPLSPLQLSSAIALAKADFNFYLFPFVFCLKLFYI